MLAEIATRRAQRRCASALRIVYSTQLTVGRDSHLPPRCEEIRNARPVMLATYRAQGGDRRPQAIEAQSERILALIAAKPDSKLGERKAPLAADGRCFGLQNLQAD
jgi:hypothetical protein